MSRAERVYWLHALSPLHVGTGRGEGYIDLPLAREKVTGFPYVPGSGVKGVFADSCGATDAERKSNPILKAAFGLAGNQTANAGALVFTDARLVCLPVRSLYGTFAWCTSRMVLRRLARDLAEIVENDDAENVEQGDPSPDKMSVAKTVPEIPSDDDPNKALLPNQPNSRLRLDNKVYLEDLDLGYSNCGKTARWSEVISKCVFPDDEPWQAEFQKRFIILPDNAFDHFSQTATEIQPHVRIDSDFKRVAKGALWYEEALPTESILAGLVWCDRMFVADVVKTKVTGLLKDQTTQMGGKGTVGKGRVQLRFSKMIPPPKTPETKGTN